MFDNMTSFFLNSWMMKATEFLGSLNVEETHVKLLLVSYRPYKVTLSRFTCKNLCS
jgi:hypothetical protein